jgi:hypothetical protein
MDPIIDSQAICTTSGRVRSNRSVDTDTHRQRAARRAGDRAPRGALPVRAGHLHVMPQAVESSPLLRAAVGRESHVPCKLPIGSAQLAPKLRPRTEVA